MPKHSLATHIKNAYVRSMHGLARLADRIGICSALDRRKEKRWAHWLLSLGAIHDIDAMIRLDVPWWTYDAIGEVSQFLHGRSDAKVLEYGSGASTVWLARRAGSVTSIEHHSGWYRALGEKLGDMANVTLVLAEASQLQAGQHPLSQKSDYTNANFRDYVDAASRYPGPYDLIVIDGRARAACLELATRHLAAGGLIVFDNSRRPRYQAALLACGGQVRRFRGLTPALPYFDETSLITFPAAEK